MKDILASALYLREDKVEAKLHMNAYTHERTHTAPYSQTNLNDGSLLITINNFLASEREASVTDRQTLRRMTAGLLYAALYSPRALSIYHQH